MPSPRSIWTNAANRVKDKVERVGDAAVTRLRGKLLPLLRVADVPQAPEYVIGVMNLRGRIVTIIDICRKLGLPPVQIDDANRNIIVRSREEHIGLWVGRISDVVAVNSDRIEATPANLNGIQGKFFRGVFKSDQHLVGLLDIEALFEM